ncbi:MAG: peptide chain release factor N(5)-glutamine methyltransferase [Actinomycetota bacterium]
MLQAEVRTLSWLVRDASARLSAAGFSSARWEGERLVAHAFGIAWGEIWVRLREEAGEQTSARLDELVRRRVAGEPLAYILCSTIFFGCEIAVGPGVLVPRPETETLVQAALELVADVPDPRIVDIGTGSGAIAIALAMERSGAEVWGTDVSKRALEWAERNVRSAGVDVQLVHGDLFEALPARTRGVFDLIVSNPPYIAEGTDLPEDVRAEPDEALFAGPDGNDVLLEVVDGSEAWLNSRGHLALEVGAPKQVDVVIDALASWRDVRVREDRTGRQRVVTARR